MVHFEQLVIVTGAVSAGRTPRRPNTSLAQQDAVVFSISGGYDEEYEDWLHNVSIFLTSECSLFANNTFLLSETTGRPFFSEINNEYRDGLGSSRKYFFNYRYRSPCYPARSEAWCTMYIGQRRCQSSKQFRDT